MLKKERYTVFVCSFRAASNFGTPRLATWERLYSGLAIRGVEFSRVGFRLRGPPGFCGYIPPLANGRRLIYFTAARSN